MIDVWSERGAPLQSRHFLLLARVALDIPPAKHAPAAGPSLASLREPSSERRFAESFSQNVISQRKAGPADLEHQARSIEDSFRKAAAEILPDRAAKPKRPWISNRTLELIEKRWALRGGNVTVANEQALNRKIRASAKQDREAWLDRLAGSGKWSDIRQLRGRVQRAQGRLNNTVGKPVA